MTAHDSRSEVGARVHSAWQQRLVAKFRERGWQPPSSEASGGPVPWEEVASLAVETLWSDLDRMIAPILELLTSSAARHERTNMPQLASSSVERPRLSMEDRPPPWLSADEAAPLLHTTAHSLRRLAREGRSPTVVRRIGGRWWFARADLDRFLGLSQVTRGDPAD